ncbi:hypothetical protein JWJ88_17050 [Paracoccus methylovorus]|uniref:Uncharacterized protein n=1 Tax=Paracoccus methylovorus TaxID=2812658 RepID=A0ABX7JRD5_9RHOB|nr:hypothetical protein [Paracoccus methylovorus]QRZ16036.1 hypothetical protein JWJ88_17050 [Paracoccus methylovorus]
MKNTKIDILKLGNLMPMHLAVNRAGLMISRGRTLIKVLGDASHLDEVLIPTDNIGCLGRVDKRDSPWAWGMIQAGICDGDQLGTRPYVGRGVGVL